MKVFVDTANLEQIKKAQELGIVDGVTTNPTLLSKEGKNATEQLKAITQLVKGPVSAEVIATDAAGMVQDALRLSKIAKNIVIKVPITIEGLKAVRMLSKKNIRTNVTLVFTPTQALLAAKAGATYVSPFVGRLDDLGEDGMKVVERIMETFRRYNFKTQVIVASIRNLEHVIRAGMCGAQIATIPFKVIDQMSKHELTDAGIKRFLEDWKKIKDK